MSTAASPFVMKTKFYRIVPITSMPLGDFRSIPAQVGTTAPMLPVAGARHLVHPQEMSLTAEVGFPPLEPANGSSLAPGCPLEWPAGLVPSASSDNDAES